MAPTTTKYRARLPQLSDRVFLTDGGIETTLIFLEGIELRSFASFELLKTAEGTAQLRRYFSRYAAMARNAGMGFVLESATWRANADWAEQLGYSKAALADVNRKAIDLMVELRDEFETARSPMVISGNIGPRGDGYNPSRKMSARQAEAYHAEQIAVFRDSAADLTSAFTINYAEEAIGIARAANTAGLPVVIALTVETDGRLPTGQQLKDAVRQIDAETGAAPAYYMINCAHPSHCAHALRSGEGWTSRLRGVRANASTRSHAESIRRPTLMPAIPWRSAANTPSCATASATSTCWVVVAAPTTVTSSRSASPASPRPRSRASRRASLPRPLHPPTDTFSHHLFPVRPGTTFRARNKSVVGTLKWAVFPGVQIDGQVRWLLPQ
jgi:S-methylmethionine-dependent homocysteine/selenocysteine methylase